MGNEIFVHRPLAAWVAQRRGYATIPSRLVLKGLGVEKRYWAAQGTLLNNENNWLRRFGDVSARVDHIPLAGRSPHQSTDGSWLGTWCSLPGTAGPVWQGIGFSPTISPDSEPEQSFSCNSTTSPIPLVAPISAIGSGSNAPREGYHPALLRGRFLGDRRRRPRPADWPTALP